MTAPAPALHVVAVGDFAAAVAEAIVAARPATAILRTASDAVGRPALPRAGAHLLVAAAPVPGYAAALDEVAFAQRVPWLPVVVEHPLLRIGPAVVPGAGACYGCWRRRLRQHAAAPDLDAAVERTYRTAGRQPQPGWLPATAQLAAAVALDVIPRLVRREKGEAGRLRQLDLVTRRLSSGLAVGVHGCPRCGLHRDERTRSSAALLADLEAGAA